MKKMKKMKKISGPGDQVHLWEAGGGRREAGTGEGYLTVLVHCYNCLNIL